MSGALLARCTEAGGEAVVGGAAGGGAALPPQVATQVLRGGASQGAGPAPLQVRPRVRGRRAEDGGGAGGRGASCRRDSRVVQGQRQGGPGRRRAVLLFDVVGGGPPGAGGPPVRGAERAVPVPPASSCGTNTAVQHTFHRRLRRAVSPALTVVSPGARPTPHRPPVLVQGREGRPGPPRVPGRRRRCQEVAAVLAAGSPSVDAAGAGAERGAAPRAALLRRRRLRLETGTLGRQETGLWVPANFLLTSAPLRQHDYTLANCGPGAKRGPLSYAIRTSHLCVLGGPGLGFGAGASGPGGRGPAPPGALEQGGFDLLVQGQPEAAMLRLPETKPSKRRRQRSPVARQPCGGAGGGGELTSGRS